MQSGGCTRAEVEDVDEDDARGMGVVHMRMSGRRGDCYNCGGWEKWRGVGLDEHGNCAKGIGHDGREQEVGA